jgi:hypothetical protein
VARAECATACWEPNPLTEPPDDYIRILADWLISPQTEEFPEVRRYLFFLKWMYETFHAIAECFPKRYVSREGQKDSCTMVTTPEEMTYLANHLFVLDSYGIEGTVLECGSFKGYSSCCLSHACAFLSRDLVIADSFEGLPSPNPHEIDYYQKGDFAGTLEEVKENIQVFGRPECVRYLKGQFSESLKGWNQPLALLWTDVDLYQSTMDVLENTFTSLDPRAAIFSHEFSKDRISVGQITYPYEPPGAYRDFLNVRGIKYRAKYLCGWTAMVAFPTSEAYGSVNFLAALMSHLREGDHRVRMAQSLNGPWRNARHLVRRILSRR